MNENTTNTNTIETTIDYEASLRMVTTRLKQIDEISKEHEGYNEEYRHLKVMEDVLWKLTKLAHPHC